MGELVPILDKLVNVGIGVLIVYGVVCFVVLGLIIVIFLSVLKQIKDTERKRLR